MAYLLVFTAVQTAVAVAAWFVFELTELLPAALVVALGSLLSARIVAARLWRKLADPSGRVPPPGWLVSRVRDQHDDPFEDIGAEMPARLAVLAAFAGYLILFALAGGEIPGDDSLAAVLLALIPALTYPGVIEGLNRVEGD